MRALSIVLTLLVVSCGNGNPADGRESTTDKLEWSILQNLEYQNREVADLEFSFIENDGYAIAQIPYSSGKGAIYIMLNPKAPPFYKQMPSIQFDLTKEQFNAIRVHSQTITTVEMAVKSHVNE